MDYFVETWTILDESCSTCVPESFASQWRWVKNFNMETFDDICDVGRCNMISLVLNYATRHIHNSSQSILISSRIYSLPKSWTHEQSWDKVRWEMTKNFLLSSLHFHTFSVARSSWRHRQSLNFFSLPPSYDTKLLLNRFSTEFSCLFTVGLASKFDWGDMKMIECRKFYAFILHHAVGDSPDCDVWNSKQNFPRAALVP